MSADKKQNTLTTIFQAICNVPRAAVIGAMHYCNKPFEKKRIVFAAATIAGGAAFGLTGAFAVAATGLTFAGMSVQAFANPMFGVPRTTRDDVMGTKEALGIINKYRAREDRRPLRFPQIDL